MPEIPNSTVSLRILRFNRNGNSTDESNSQKNKNKSCSTSNSRRKNILAAQQIYGLNSTTVLNKHRHVGRPSNCRPRKKETTLDQIKIIIKNKHNKLTIKTNGRF